MGVCISPNLFQAKISELFDAFNMVSVYIDDVLVITNNNLEDHIKALDMVL